MKTLILAYTITSMVAFCPAAETYKAGIIFLNAPCTKTGTACVGGIEVSVSVTAATCDEAAAGLKAAIREFEK